MKRISLISMTFVSKIQSIMDKNGNVQIIEQIRQNENLLILKNMNHMKAQEEVSTPD